MQGIVKMKLQDFISIPAFYTDIQIDISIIYELCEISPLFSFTKKKRGFHLSSFHDHIYGSREYCFFALASPG